MVATRKSLPAALDDSSNLTHKQRAALKALQIDAHDAILSGQREVKDGKTKIYHWRGAAYEYQGNEPPDWLKAEKQRHSLPGKRKRESERPVVPSVKKHRSRLSNITGAKPLRSPSAAASSTKAPRSSTSSDQPLRASKSAIYDHRAYDYTRYGPRDTKSCVEAAREAAQKKGYQVCPLAEDALVNANGKWLAAKVCEMAKLNGKAATLVERYNGVRRWVWDGENREHSLGTQLQEIPESSEPQLARWTQENETTTTSTTRTVVHTTRTTTKHHATKAPSPCRPQAAITTRAKGGQTVRWSIDPSSRPYEGADEMRAEEAIFHGRLAGESKQARRRRLRRELQSVEAWDRLEE